MILTWLQTIIRGTFFAIDNALYYFIESVYNLIIDISRTSILTQGQIKMFADRIQILLAVFMLFKVSISIITYIVNPDDFSDKSKGFGKLLQNTIISLLMLVLVPYAFSMAYEFQKIVLEDNTLATLILGAEDSDNFIDTGGSRLAFSTMLPFFRPNVSFDNRMIECNVLYDTDPNSDTIYNNDCKEAMVNATRDNHNDTLDETIIDNYMQGIAHRQIGLTFRMQAVTFNQNDKFLFDYKAPLSTVAAIVVGLFLITLCMDIALRSVKLAFLQLIAPIPIVSFMDPKSGKDGLFSKWYKLCFSTYLSLFVRLAALYFGLYIIDVVIIRGFTDIINGETVTGFWIQFFMIIGILMFIKQLPKILEGLGIKLDGGGKFQLNPFKKFEEEAFGGKRILGATGGMVSGVADRGARIMTAQGMKNKFKAAAGGFVGVPGAAIRGFRSGKGFSGGMEAQNSVNRRLREGRIKGLSPSQSYLDYVGSRFGLDDATLEREGIYLHNNKDEITNAENRIKESTKAHTLKITDLEQKNAVRKDTQSKLKNVKSKGDAVLENNADFLKKKANFGNNSSDDRLLSYYSGLSGSGIVTSSDIKLSDGETLKKGTLIDDAMIALIERSKSKDYTLKMNANESNIKMMTGIPMGDKLKDSITIGKEVFAKNTIVTGDVIARAQKAAAEYEKYATEQLLNAFIKNDTGGTTSIDRNDRQVFINLQNEYVNAVDDANKSILTYNTTYSKSVGPVINTISDYKSFDSEMKNLKNGKDVTDMAVDSEQIDRQIADEKRFIEDIKHNEKVKYTDENGVVTTKSLDEAKLLFEPREKQHKEKIESHQQRRALMKDAMGGKG